MKIGSEVKVKCKKGDYTGYIIDFDLYTGDPVVSTNNGIRCPKMQYCKVSSEVGMIRYLLVMVAVLVFTMLIFAGAMSVIFNYGVF